MSGKDAKMDEDKPKIQAKVAFVGYAYTGKTAIIKRLIERKFTETNESTIGAYVVKYTVELSAAKIKLSIWDTAGQEKYRSLIQNYYRDAKGIILVYDVTKKASFDEAQRLIGDIRSGTPEGTIIILVGNKVDLSDSREVTLEEGRKLAESKKTLFIETSAKSGEGVDEMIELVAEAIQKLPPDANSEDDDIIVAPVKKGGCC